MINYNILVWCIFAMVLLSITLGVFGTVAYAESKKDNQKIKNLEADHVTVDGRAIFGNYTGMDTKSIENTTGSDTLPNNTVVTLLSTSNAFTDLYLPAAKKSNRIVVVFGGNVGLDIKSLRISGQLGETYAEGIVAPSTTSGYKMEFIKSSKGSQTMNYAIESGSNDHILSKGSVIEFICDKDGEWQVYFNIVISENSTNSTGEISFT